MSDELLAKIAKLEADNTWLRQEIQALRETLDQDQEAAAINEVRLRLAYFSTIQALARAIEAKDPYTVGHSEMVSKVAVAIARRLELTDDECERVRIAGQGFDKEMVAGAVGTVVL